jgi:hypothetical protein
MLHMSSATVKFVLAALRKKGIIRAGEGHTPRYSVATNLTPEQTSLAMRLAE